MAQSILTSVKQLVNLEENDTSFDLDIMILINSTFGVLNQMGVGPSEGYSIASKTPTWDDFLDPGPLSSLVQSYVAKKVQQSFDPPSTGYHTTSLENVIKELETRISYMREDVEWTPPPSATGHSLPEDIFGEGYILDGG